MSKHWTDIDIYAELEDKAVEIDALLDDANKNNPRLKALGGMELLLLEMLGYVVDLVTGSVSKKSVDNFDRQGLIER